MLAALGPTSHGLYLQYSQYFSPYHGLHYNIYILLYYSGRSIIPSRAARTPAGGTAVRSRDEFRTINRRRWHGRWRAARAAVQRKSSVRHKKTCCVFSGSISLDNTILLLTSLACANAKGDPLVPIINFSGLLSLLIFRFSNL